MKNRNPKIGVTGPDRGGTIAWLFLRFAIWLQGGDPVRITPADPKTGVDLDGLILGGGADINPQYYGQILPDEPTKRDKPIGFWGWMKRIFSWFFYPILFLIRKLFSVSSTTIDMSRDALEFDLLEKAVEKQIPILGICRGAQLINIKLGGTLHQEVAGFYGETPEIRSILPRKKVDVKNSSKLHDILKAERISVNALNHQAIDKVGEKIRIAAREKNGIIQAIEHVSYPFLIGVQWHPEYMPQISRQRNVFKQLVYKAMKTDSSRQ